MQATGSQNNTIAQGLAPSLAFAHLDSDKLECVQLQTST